MNKPRYLPKTKPLPKKSRYLPKDKELTVPTSQLPVLTPDVVTKGLLSLEQQLEDIARMGVPRKLLPSFVELFRNFTEGTVVRSRKQILALRRELQASVADILTFPKEAEARHRMELASIEEKISELNTLKEQWRIHLQTYKVEAEALIAESKKRIRMSEEDLHDNDYAQDTKEEEK